ncbi:hypothetical protein BAPKO_2517 (plasmid) [Borreliella afzelii PKo]|nr:hypothetical protein BAPKO_2517 [Borreliella afzelii PKo]
MPTPEYLESVKAGILGFKPIEEDIKENNKKLQGIY